MHDPRGRLLSEEPPESVEKKRRTALVIGAVVIAMGSMPLLFANDIVTAVVGTLFIVGFGGFIMFWSRMASPTRVFDGGIEFFGGLGSKFVPWQEMGNYYESNGLVLRYYPEVRMGSTSSGSYRIHVPSSMPNYNQISAYIKRMVDRNPDAHGTKVYIGTGPMRFRMK